MSPEGDAPPHPTTDDELEQLSSDPLDVVTIDPETRERRVEGTMTGATWRGRSTIAEA